MAPWLGAHCLIEEELSSIKIVSLAAKKEVRAIEKIVTSSSDSVMHVEAASDLAVLRLAEEIPLPAQPAELPSVELKVGSTIRVKSRDLPRLPRAGPHYRCH